MSALTAVALILMVGTQSPQGDWSRADEQVWYQPTHQDLVDCSGMAEEINDVTVAALADPRFAGKLPIREALCIVVPAEPEPEPAPPPKGKAKPAALRF